MSLTEREYPGYMVVMVSYACNLRCPACPHGHRDELKEFFCNKKTFMSFDEFKTIVDEVAQYRPKIGLNSLGEVFMNPEIYTMLSYAHDKGLRTEFDTNGLLVDPVELAKVHVTDIIFSIDGFTEEAYRKYRRGGSLEKAKAHLNAYAEEVAQRGSETRIFVKYLVNNYTEEHLEEARNYYESLPGVTFMIDFFFPPEPSFKMKHEHPDAVPLDVYEQWRPKTHPQWDLFFPIEEEGLAYNKALSKPFANQCQDPFTIMYIDTDGSAYPCCQAISPQPPDYVHFPRELYYGNVFNEGVLGTFKGERAEAFRRAYKEKKGKVGICGNCRSNRVKLNQECVISKEDILEYKTLLTWEEKE